MILLLDPDEYGFIPNKRSSITFLINGACLGGTNCDIYFGFGDNEKYLTLLISMDERGATGPLSSPPRGIWGYPSCGDSLRLGNIVSIFNNSIGESRHEAAGGNRSNWNALSNETDVLWPIKIQIYNDYRVNEIGVSIESNGGRFASCSFQDIFNSNSDLYFNIRNQGFGGSTGDGRNGIEIYDITISTDNGKITALNDNDPFIEITTATSTISDTSSSMPYWFVSNDFNTDPPAWYVCTYSMFRFFRPEFHQKQVI